MEFCKESNHGDGSCDQCLITRTVPVMIQSSLSPVKLKAITSAITVAAVSTTAIMMAASMVSSMPPTSPAASRALMVVSWAMIP